MQSTSFYLYHESKQILGNQFYKRSTLLMNRKTLPVNSISLVLFKISNFWSYIKQLLKKKKIVDTPK